MIKPSKGFSEKSTSPLVPKINVAFRITMAILKLENNV